MKGIITIEFEGVTFQETERFRKMIHTLFSQGVFNLRRGQATLHFDFQGTLSGIDIFQNKWRDNKPLDPLDSLYKGAKIEILTTSDTQTQIKSGVAK